MAAALALRELQPPAPWERLCDGAATVALFVQIGLWSGAFLDRWINASRDRALRADPESVTGLAAASFLLRLVSWSLLSLMLLDNLGVNVTAVLTGLGVGGVAVGLALQSILKDLFASLSIVLDKPFQIGHFIVVDGLPGTVENIGLKTTRIRALDGEQYVFSNADLTMARVRNFRDMHQRRIEQRFVLNLDTDPRALEQLPRVLREIVQALPDVRFERAHLKDIEPEGLRFEIVYWICQPDYTLYMNTRHAINLALLRALRARSVRLAQPVREIVLQRSNEMRPHGAASS
ncbi:MAG: mechanosensitive ion channel [Betaproteobacteria bacterium]|nr:mechanosensitive ion channel [Betaproteobacteria bacterium]